MAKAKVKDDKTLVRDLNTTAILAADRVALGQHRAHRRAIQSKEEEMNQLKDQVAKLTELVQALISSKAEE
jgi:hypothetical protein